VGGNDEIPVDVRVICATNRDLNDLVDKGTFRKDLFFRITGFPIRMPPLRERTDDIIPLAWHFLDRYKGSAAVQLTDGARRLLKGYPWPGNVRELANAVERAVILVGDNGFITAETLSFLRADPPAGLEYKGLCLSQSGVSIEELEKDLVKQALEISNNNQMAAARMLGITRAKFRVLIKRLKKGG